jgi:hypothetical protein
MSRVMPQPASSWAPDPGEALDPADRAVIDQALQVVQAEHHCLATKLGSPAALEPPDLEHLRQGPLGQDLAFLARVARGAEAPTERVLDAIEAAVQLLFWPAAADDYRVPRAFWTTELGRLLARAKFRAFAPAELLSIGAAGRRLGVARPAVYRWIDDRTLEAVRDERTGRTYVVRCGIDAMTRVARELAAPS